MQKFIIAALASLAVARKERNHRMEKQVNIKKDSMKFVALEGEEQLKFIEWVSHNTKNYGSNNEMNKRLKNWKRNNKIIREHNKKALASGKKYPVILDHNGLSDLSEEDLSKRLGFVNKDDDDRRLSDEEMPRDLSSLDEPLTAQTVDWSWATSPVTDQGQCGSCWAFAGNTVLEAQDYINNTSANPVRKSLSHQFPVDCAPDTYPTWLFGCNGGSADRMWEWYQNVGTVSSADYPYTSGMTGSTGASCSPPATTDPGLVGLVGLAENESTMISAISLRPMTASFAVDVNTFGFYSFGMITSEDGNGCLDLAAQGLPSWYTNHEMVLAGYDSVGQGGVYTMEQQTNMLSARWKTEEEYTTGCGPDPWFQWPQYPDYCLKYNYITVEEVMAEGPFWKVQNSWGEGWGHDGYAYFAVAGGDGTCNMNKNGGRWVITV